MLDRISIPGSRRLAPRRKARIIILQRIRLVLLAGIACLPPGPKELLDFLDAVLELSDITTQAVKRLD